MKHFKRKIFNIIALLGITVLLGSQIALAEPTFKNVYQKCDEGVHPFISNARPAQISTSDSDVNHPSEAECFTHLTGTFPSNQHIQPPESVTHVPLITTQKSVPKAIHEHHYINESNDADDQGLYYKRAWLRSFKIILQPDFKAVLKPNTLFCPIPDDGNPSHYDNGFASCNHTNPDVFGGTKVEFDGTTIKYTFGLNQPQKGYKPIIPGINPEIDQGVFFPDDTTNVLNRLFSMTIDFETKDQFTLSKKEIWTATSTSQAEIIHTAIPKLAFPTGKLHSCTDGGVWNASNSWCNVGGYQWVNVATDVTVWETQSKTAPNICTDLKLTWTPASDKLGANTPVTFHVTPSFSNPTVIPLKYKWLSTPGPILPTGSVSLGNNFGQASLLAANNVLSDSGANVPISKNGIDLGSAANPNVGTNKFADSSSTTDFANPYTDDDRDTYYTGGPGNTNITVQAIDPLGSDTSKCKAAVYIPPEVLQESVCESLTLTPNTIKNGSNDYTAQVKFKDGKSYNTEVTWTETKGTFPGGKTSTVDTHQSSTIFRNNFTTNDQTATLTATVTNVTGAKNSPACKATITGQPSGLVCYKLNASPVDSTLPIGVATLISADPVNSDQSKPDKVVWTETGDGFFKNIPGTSPACAQAVAGVITQPASANTSFTAPATCKYNFTAAANSVLTLEASPNLGNIADCKKVYTTGQEIAACKSLKITNPNIQNGVLFFTQGQSINEIFNLNVEKTGDLPLDYHWTEDPLSGSFDNKQTPYTDSDTKTNYVSTNPKDGTKIHVQAFAIGVAPLPQALCQDDLIIKLKSPPGQVCDDTKFTLNSSNGNTLTVNQPTTLLASGKKTDGTDLTQLNWTTTSGLLTPFGTCTGQGSGQNLTLASTCPVMFSGGPQGTVVTVSSVPPEQGNICKRNINVNNQPTNVCNYLTIIPQGNNNYCVQTNPVEYNSQVNWIYTAGSFNLYNNNQCIHLQSTPPNAVLSANVPNQPKCQGNITFPPSGNECTSMNVTTSGNNYYCATTSPGNYPVLWNYNGNNSLQPTANGNQQCVQIVGTPTPGSTLKGDVANSTNCHYITNFNATPPTPPTIEKDVKFVSSGEYTKVLNLSYNSEKRVQYRIRFSANGPTTTTLTDTITGGQINGQYPSQFVSDPNTPNPGHIEYRDNMTVNGNNIHQCDTNKLDTESNCYVGDISTGLRLVKVSGLVTITYLGEIVNSSINQDSCNQGHVCEEVYTNTVKAPYIMYDSQGNPMTCQMDANGMTTCQITSNEVRIQIFCQYILTRAAGDVYLEQDLNAGVDIYKCSNYKSTTGVLVSPAPESQRILNQTGGGETVTIGHEVCSKGQAGTLPDQLKDLYGKGTSKLSSQICEIRLRPGSSWQKSAITNTIEENKTRISRWEPNLPPGVTTSSISDLNNRFSSSNGVYHSKGDLIIDPGSTDFIQYGDGANTIIVEDGDLIIRNNITVNPTCSKSQCNVRDTASLAFIVLNGNIYVDKNVTELTGVYFVQQGDTTNGKLISGSKTSPDEDSDKKLTVLGSIYGDIQPLFAHRFAPADPKEGSTIIRFDESIMLNTPPGLQDLVNIKENEVAR